MIFLFWLLSCLYLARADPYPTSDVTHSLESDVQAEYAFLVDADTGSVLLNQKGDALMHPSSMTKIMTMYVVAQKLKSKAITPETLLTVSRNAYRREGSSMFLNVDQEVSVSDLIKGVVIQSGNDACVVLAEALAGSETAFAQEMTRVARELGATQTHFTNVTGIPSPEHQTTPRDLALLAKRMLQDFPEYTSLSVQKEFTFGGIKQGNRNPLLYKNIGCIWGKTGSSTIAGYGLAAVCEQKDQKLILIINGLRSMQKRSDEAVKLFTWGFQSFENRKILQQGEKLKEIPIFYGTTREVSLTVPKSIVLTAPRMEKKEDTKILCSVTKLEAPIQKGTVVGTVTITAPYLKEPYVVPLVVGEDVLKGNFWTCCVDFFRIKWGSHG